MLNKPHLMSKKVTHRTPVTSHKPPTTQSPPWGLALFCTWCCTTLGSPWTVFQGRCQCWYWGSHCHCQATAVPVVPITPTGDNVQRSRSRSLVTQNVFQNLSAAWKHCRVVNTWKTTQDETCLHIGLIAAPASPEMTKRGNIHQHC